MNILEEAEKLVGEANQALLESVPRKMKILEAIAYEAEREKETSKKTSELLARMERAVDALEDHVNESNYSIGRLCEAHSAVAETLPSEIMKTVPELKE